MSRTYTCSGCGGPSPKRIRCPCGFHGYCGLECKRIFQKVRIKIECENEVRDQARLAHDSTPCWPPPEVGQTCFCGDKVAHYRAVVCGNLALLRARLGSRCANDTVLGVPIFFDFAQPRTSWTTRRRILELYRFHRGSLSMEWHPGKFTFSSLKDQCETLVEWYMAGRQILPFAQEDKVVLSANWTRSAQAHNQLLFLRFMLTCEPELVLGAKVHVHPALLPRVSCIVQTFLGEIEKVVNSIVTSSIRDLTLIVMGYAFDADDVCLLQNVSQILIPRKNFL